MNQAIIIAGEEHTKNVRILALRGMLKLEVLGLSRRGQSAYSIVKKEFGFKGTKQRVLDQLNEYIEKNILPSQ